MSDPQPDPPKEVVTLGIVVLSVVVYLAGVVGCIVAMSRASAEHLALIYPLALPLFSGGALKLINIVQNFRTDRKVTETDRKVTEDVHTTKKVEKLVNGGLEERIKSAVAKALEEREKTPKS